MVERRTSDKHQLAQHELRKQHAGQAELKTELNKERAEGRGKEKSKESGGGGGRRIHVRGTHERTAPPMHVPPEKMWNEGEKFCQEQLGKREHVEEIYNKTVFSEIPDMNVWRFLEQRHVVYVAVMDPETGQVWNCPVFANPRRARDGTPGIAGLPLESSEEEVPPVPLAPELRDASSLSRQEHDADEMEITRQVGRGIGDVVVEEREEVMYCRPWDPSSAGTAVGNLTSPFQASSYYPLVHIKNRKLIRILKPPHRDDPLWNCLKNPGVHMSINFLEHETRKRWRANGVLRDPISDNGFSMEVAEIFSTCPRYITERTVVALRKKGPEATVFSDPANPELTDELIQFITHADTFFIATIAPGWGADSSHRAGRPGFIRVIDKHILMWPDYHGMYKFQTLGNTVLYPRGGLLFIDYFRGHTLQVTGKMKLHFLKDQKHYYLDGRNRVVTFEIEKWIFRRKSCPFKWRLLKFSSTLPIMTDSPILRDMFAKEHGHQCQVVSNIEPFKEYGAIRARVKEVVRRTKDVKSFIFEATDGQKFEYMAGMWATFTLDINGERNMRNWTLSSGNCTLLDGIPISSQEFESNHFEITVKRTRGATSPWLHEHVKEGTRIILNGVEGTFTLNSSRRILLRDLSTGRIGGIGARENEMEDILRKRDEILKRPGHEWWKLLVISGGIGVTPIVGMFRSLQIMCHERGIMSAEQLPDITFIHSEHTVDDIPFSELYHHLIVELGDIPVIDRIAFVLSREKEEEKDQVLKKLRGLIGRNEEDESVTALVGQRMSVDFLEATVPDVTDRFVYLCGPPKFMEAVKKHLLTLRVPLEHILTENFAD